LFWRTSLSVCDTVSAQASHQRRRFRRRKHDQAGIEGESVRPAGAHLKHQVEESHVYGVPRIFEGPQENTMTTIQIQLPDDLAQDAQAAGLLTPEAIERLLRERLRRQAGDALQAMWNRMPAEELTPEIEEMINEEVQAVRAERRQRTAN
jgi:hypothetical protein